MKNEALKVNYNASNTINERPIIMIDDTLEVREGSKCTRGVIVIFSNILSSNVGLPTPSKPRAGRCHFPAQSKHLAFVVAHIQFG